MSMTVVNTSEYFPLLTPFLTFDDGTHALRLGVSCHPAFRKLGLDGAPRQGAGRRGTNGVLALALNRAGGRRRGSDGRVGGEGEEEEEADDGEEKAVAHDC